MKKGLVIVLLTLSLVLALSSAALAGIGNSDESIIENISSDNNAEDIMPLRYGLIHTIVATLDITDNIAQCGSEVKTQEVVASIQITMTLQKYSGGKWTTYAQWSRTRYDTNIFALAEEIAVGSGSYRVYAVGTATPYEGDPETQTAISTVKP